MQRIFFHRALHSSDTFNTFVCRSSDNYPKNKEKQTPIFPSIYNYYFSYSAHILFFAKMRFFQSQQRRVPSKKEDIPNKIPSLFESLCFIRVNFIAAFRMHNLLKQRMQVNHDQQHETNSMSLFIPVPRNNDANTLINIHYTQKSCNLSFFEKLHCSG